MVARRKSEAKPDLCRVGGKASQRVVATRLSDDEHAHLEAKAQAHGATSGGLLLRAWVQASMAGKLVEASPAPAPRSLFIYAQIDDMVERGDLAELESVGDAITDALCVARRGVDPSARVGLSAEVSVLASARWLVELLEQHRGPDLGELVERAADDLRKLLEGAPVPPPASGPRAADPLVDVPLKPERFRREPAPYDGDPPTPREVLRFIAKKPATLQAMIARWPRVRGAWISEQIRVLCKLQLVRTRRGDRRWFATEIGASVASLTAEQRTPPPFSRKRDCPA